MANNAKSEFLSRISHDIRTPISAIISMTEFAREDMGDAEKLLKDIDAISASNKFLLSLINDILDISKIDSGKMELYPECYSFDEFAKSICGIFIPLCQQKKIDFRIISGESAGQGIIVDKVRFNQVALNILSNAVKYTPQGGRIVYTSRSELLTEDKVRCVYTVQDTGIGMSEAFQKNMFEPFVREESQKNGKNALTGTGLGLAIVKKILDLMGGTIAIQSRCGEGTTVTVSIVLPGRPARRWRRRRGKPPAARRLKKRCRAERCCWPKTT